MNRTYFFILLLFAYCSIKAQTIERKEKFGKVPEELLQLKVYAKDTNAYAFVDYRICENEFNYDPSTLAIHLVERCHERIKILHKNGYDQAQKTIFLRKAVGQKDDDLKLFRACTYNYENGEIIETKINKIDLLTENDNEFGISKKMAFKDIRPGSVIEYEYEIERKSIFQTTPFYFQSTIPVAWAETSMLIPNFFEYVSISNNFEPYTIHTKEDHLAWGLGHTRGTKFRYAHEYQPAFNPREKYIYNLNDHLARIEFQIQAYTPPNGRRQEFFSSWGNLCNHFIDADKHGYYTKQFASDGHNLETSIEIGSKDNDSLVKKTYNFITSNFRWNGYNSVYSDKTMRQMIADKTGNRSAINLMACGILKKLGVDVYPVLSSTREYGMISTIYPIISKFNTTLLTLRYGGKMVLMDFCHPGYPLTIINEELLNGTGLAIMAKDSYKWISLESDVKTIIVKELTAEINPATGMVSGECNGSVSGSYGMELAEDAKSDIQKTLRSLLIINEESDPNLMELSGRIPPERPDIFLFRSKYEIHNGATVAGNIIYINPFLFIADDSNPFYQQYRYSDIELGSLIAENFVARINIPPGYTIDEVPEETSLSIKDNAALFSYNVQIDTDKNQINVIYKNNLKKVKFPAEEYAILQEYYSLISQSVSKQIVLSKNQ